MGLVTPPWISCLDMFRAGTSSSAFPWLPLARAEREAMERTICRVDESLARWWLQNGRVFLYSASWSAGFTDRALVVRSRRVRDAVDGRRCVSSSCLANRESDMCSQCEWSAHLNVPDAQAMALWGLPVCLLWPFSSQPLLKFSSAFNTYFLHFQAFHPHWQNFAFVELYKAHLIQKCLPTTPPLAHTRPLVSTATATSTR